MDLLIDQTRLKLPLRHQRLLVSMVEIYIDTAQPVSSSVLAHKHPEWGLSAATLRHSLAEMTEKGLLQQPFKSSGRIPTELGLRTYVNYLVCPKLKPWDRSRIAATYQAEPSSFAMELGKTLSRMSRGVAVVTTPKLAGSILREVGLVWCNHTQLLAYLISTSGESVQELVKLPFTVTQDEVHQISHYLNDSLAYKPCDKAVTYLQSERLDTQKSRCELEKKALSIGQQILSKMPLNIVVEGTFFLFEHQEFADLAKLRHLLEVLKKQEFILELASSLLSRVGDVILLGSEPLLTKLSHLACVACTVESEQAGRINVSLLGPKRMDYSRLMPMVRYATLTASRFFSATKR